MIGNTRPWSLATPEDKDYSDYLMDRTVLFDMLPVSQSGYMLLKKIFSARPEQRPSLAAIRAEVLAMDTFFLTSAEAARCGWADSMEKQMLRKIRARGAVAAAAPSSSSARSDSFETCSLGSSSASRYSSGSSSSAFDSSSAESSDLPATPPAPVAEVVRTLGKASRLVLFPRVDAMHWQTC